jgi:hypothetical protein
LRARGWLDLLTGEDVRRFVENDQKFYIRSKAIKTLVLAERLHVMITGSSIELERLA